jgi:outer membrane protein
MKRMMRSLWIGLTAATMILSAESQILTIDKAIEIALTHSPNIDMSRFDFEGAVERNKFQKGYYLPRLDLGAVAGKQNMAYKEQADLSGTALIGNLNASQLIYDFGKTSGRISASDKEASAYQATMNQVISRKILTIKTRYYDALKMKSIIKVNHKNIKLQKGQLRRAQRYYDNGIKTIIDVSDAQVRLTQAKLDLSNSEYELKLRLALLEEAMGYVPYSGHYDLYHSESDSDIESMGYRLPVIKTSLAQLVGFAYDHRFELKSSKYLVEGSQSMVESEKGDYFPTLSLKGDYMGQSVDQDFIGLTPERQWQAGVDLKWNLFRGLQTDASVQEAKISVMRAASRVEEVRLVIKRQVTESRLQVMRSKDAVTLSESIAKASAKKFDQAKKRYENDLSDYIEYQEAQQGYIRSLGELVVSYYDYYIALSQLDFAVGR